MILLPDYILTLEDVKLRDLDNYRMYPIKANTLLTVEDWVMDDERGMSGFIVSLDCREYDIPTDSEDCMEKFEMLWKGGQEQMFRKGV